jgi:pimeloyl-ACP methyl ester carboxylesterase
VNAAPDGRRRRHLKHDLPSWSPRSVASFVPSDPVRVLVLAHGYPWPDGSRSDGELIGYAQAAVERWAAFAERHHAIVVAPAFGGQEFPLYREMLGRSIDPDKYVNLLAAKAGQEHIAGFGGRFSLHGHSAGAQFAARCLVTHPRRLDEVILSAPSAFPMPDPGIPWPNGMAPARGFEFSPRAAGWLAAASEVRVTVLVGSRDTEQRPPAPGQQGATRIERGGAWVESMRHHAQGEGKAASIRFVSAEGLDHDEEAMAAPAQEIMAQSWRTADLRR